MNGRVRKFEQWQDMLGRLYPEFRKNGDGSDKVLSRTVTFQVTDRCSLACTYCYQINKKTRVMKFEYAKKLIDALLEGDEKFSDYVNVDTSPGIIIEFIGGEPLLEPELIEQICDYFEKRAIELMHPWALHHEFSICSNGVAYFEPKVQHLLNKYRHKLSFSVTIDGNKELHDSCRVFPDGVTGSYDLAVAAAQDWINHGGYMGSKITIAPGNIKYIYDAITHMVELGYQEINANTVYEKGWTIEHAKIFYQELKRIADYWIDHDIVESHFLALFNEDFFKPKDEKDLDNWCGGNAMMLSMDPDGYLYPCIRYMESSLGDERKPYRIGHVDIGIAQDECTHNCVECLRKITRKTQSTDECFYCPIAEGCSWCFKAGTLIETPTGFVPIEKLKIGDSVLDGEGNIQIVENNIKHETTNLIYVKASGLSDLLTTKDHPFLTKKFIKRDNKFPIYGKPEWVKAEELQTSDRIALFVHKLGTKNINKNFAYVIGRYIGNGWKTNSNRKKHPYKYYICTAFDEQMEFEFYLNKSGIKYSKYYNRTVIEYNLHISDNEYMVNLLDDSGRYEKTKKVPQEVFTWNKESITSFLNGYFDADGYIDKKRNVQRFTSISYELILGIAELVRMTYHKNVNITKRIPAEKRIIEGRIINQSISYEGRFNIHKEKKKYYEYDNTHNIMWVNVGNSKKDTPKSEVVYNLTVSNSHTYIANGAIVHNCTAYNYQETGTPDKRVTYICDMHKARALANVYFWNKWYIKTKQNKVFKNHVPDDWALTIIDKDELDYLKSLEKR